MGRQPKKCPKKCTKHLISLKPVHYSAFFSRESQFLYCGQNLKTQANIPKFNRDGKPYTASFILASDQLKLITNDQIYQMEHERIKKQNHEQKTQILIPKPRTKNCYCSICKQIYDDYLQHISCLKHKEYIKKNQFNAQILYLCQGFRNNIKKSPMITYPGQALSPLSYSLTCSTLHSQEHQKTQEIQKHKFMDPQYEDPQFFIQKSTKETLDGLTICKSIKSFHSYAQLFEAKQENCIQDNFPHLSLIKEINQNCIIPPYGNFKAIEQTASPLKTKLQKPIILAGKCFTLDY